MSLSNCLKEQQQQQQQQQQLHHMKTVNQSEKKKKSSRKLDSKIVYEVTNICDLMLCLRDFCPFLYCSLKNNRFQPVEVGACCGLQPIEHLWELNLPLRYEPLIGWSLQKSDVIKCSNLPSHHFQPKIRVFLPLGFPLTSGVFMCLFLHVV